MAELALSTPSILFSAISLIMIAYTTRFLEYARLVRSLAAEHEKNPSERHLRQIENLRKRLTLTRWMQILGISSLFLCVVCTLLIYIGQHAAAIWIFGAALLSMIVSLGFSLAEIQISAKALDIHLDNIEKHKNK